MNYTPIQCHNSLKPFIRNYWTLTAHCTAQGTQRMFSNGADNLQFYLSQSVRLNGSDLRYKTVLYHQSMKSMGIITEKGDLVIFGVEFVPFCSKMFFRSEHKAEFLTPEATRDEAFIQLCIAIHQAENTEERVLLLDNFFLQRLAEFPENDVNLSRLNEVFDEMIPTYGSTEHTPGIYNEVSTADLASAACLSQKQFTRIFNKYVGMNPKAYLRLLRFHKALQELQLSASETSLVDIAWKCGYYDSSHMAADFRDICGFTPSELIKADSGLTEVFQPNFSGSMRKKILIENLI